MPQCAQPLLVVIRPFWLASHARPLTLHKYCSRAGRPMGPKNSPWGTMGASPSPRLYSPAHNTHT
eukprot:4895459-Alexandrium_andersonii.AAC.1